MYAKNGGSDNTAGTHPFAVGNLVFVALGAIQNAACTILAFYKLYNSMRRNAPTCHFKCNYISDLQVGGVDLFNIDKRAGGVDPLHRARQDRKGRQPEKLKAVKQKRQRYHKD